MKAKILKLSAFAVSAIAILFVSMAATKNVFKTMQNIYGLQPYGKIITCVTDMLQ